MVSQHESIIKRNEVGQWESDKGNRFPDVMNFCTQNIDGLSATNGSLNSTMLQHIDPNAYISIMELSAASLASLCSNSGAYESAVLKATLKKTCD